MNTRSAGARRLSGTLLAVYWVAIFVTTHIPNPEAIAPKVSDKTLHFGAYAGLTLLWLAWLQTRSKLHWKWLGWTLPLMAVYGAADEILQIPVGRHCDLYDWFADMGGVAIGLFLGAAFLWVTSRPR